MFSLRATLNGRLYLVFGEPLLPKSPVLQCQGQSCMDGFRVHIFSLPSNPVLNDSRKHLNRASPRSDQSHCLAELSAPWFPSNSVVSLMPFCIQCGTFASALGSNSGSICDRNLSLLRRCCIATRAMQVALIGALTQGTLKSESLVAQVELRRSRRPKGQILQSFPFQSHTKKHTSRFGRF